MVTEGLGLSIFFISIYYGLFSILQYFVIIITFIVKLFPLPVVLFPQGFPRINMMFFFVFVFGMNFGELL